MKYSENLPQCFRALSNPVRLKVFLKILEKSCECDVDMKKGMGGNCVTQIAVELELPQPTVSNHVKELSNCGLVKTHRKGRKVFLFVDPKVAEEFSEFSEFVTNKVASYGDAFSG